MEGNESVVKVQNISKLYHLWKSPTHRLRYGLWSQVPPWAPEKLRILAQRKKRELGQDFKALDSVSLEVKHGEVIGILGRNGSGKSTLLQIIAGTLTPTSGTVSIDGRITALLELGSGFDPEFTGRENVFLNGAVLGFSRQQIEARLDEILQFSELTAFIDQPVKTYSSGMAVRLAFAVQVLLDPQILIVDEALAVGDVFFQQKCYKRMRTLVDRGVSILLATHDLRAVYQFCDRAVVLNQGEIVFAGNASEAAKKFNYLVSPGTRPGGIVQPIKTGQNGRTRVAASERLSFSSATGERNWPEANLFSSVETEHHDRSDLAQCLRYCVLDKRGQSTTVFENGERASFFFEFLMHEDFPAVSGGFSLKDRFGDLIHAKHAIQSGPFGSLPHAKKEERIRFAAEVALDIEPGQYTLEFGIVGISMPRSDLASLQSLDLLTFQSFSQRLCSTKPVCVIVVNFKTSYVGLQLEHYGLANLPSKVECLDVKSHPESSS
jgi:lipopolysaccharide transport system ATP-binding protein